MNISFENKVVVITGAMGGIGKGMISRFVSDGATVIACDLKGAKDGAGEFGAIGYDFDITNRDEVEKTFSEVCFTS